MRTAPSFSVAVAMLLAPLSAKAGVSSVSIINPSFQADVFVNFPGYASNNGGQITGWSGNGNFGINGPDGSNYPFSDGTKVDGSRLAFIQQTGSLNQTVGGLTPGQRYVFQGWFRGRTGVAPTFSVSLGAQALLIGQTVPSGGPWQPFVTTFVAGTSSGLLNISSSVSGGGDGTLALDSILLFGQSADYVNIWNPSFESGTSYDFPGYEGTIAGWSTTGSTGFNFAGNNPFSPTGAVPDGSTFAFIQNNGSMAQTLIGLTPGQQYLFEIDANSRNGYPQGHIQVKLDGATLFDGMLNAVSGSDPFHHLGLSWTAGNNTALLEIIGIQNGSDSAIAFDNISLRAVPEPASSICAALGLLLTTLRRRRG